MINLKGGLTGFISATMRIIRSFVGHRHDQPNGRALLRTRTPAHGAAKPLGPHLHVREAMVHSRVDLRVRVEAGTVVHDDKMELAAEAAHRHIDRARTRMLPCVGDRLFGHAYE